MIKKAKLVALISATTLSTLPVIAQETALSADEQNALASYLCSSLDQGTPIEYSFAQIQSYLYENHPYINQHRAMQGVANEFASEVSRLSQSLGGTPLQSQRRYRRNYEKERKFIESEAFIITATALTKTCPHHLNLHHYNFMRLLSPEMPPAPISP